MRQLHRVVGALLAVLFVLLAVTGLLLRHEQWARRVLGESVPARGPFTDRTTALAIDPFVAGHHFAATTRDFYESQDGGATWTSVLLPVPASGVVSVAFAPRDSARVLVATADGGVFVSSDGGSVWDDAGLPANAIDSHIQFAAFAPDGTLLVRAGSGMYARDARGAWSLRTRAGADRTTMKRLVDLHAGRWPAPLLGVLIDVAAIGLLVLVVTGVSILLQRTERRTRITRR